MEPYSSNNRKTITEAFHRLQIREKFSECHPSQDVNGFASSMKNMNKILQLIHLNVSGVADIKPHFRCFRKSNAGEQYLYLGKHKGDYYVHKKFRLRNPLIWLRNDNGVFSIFIMAGFYPCSHRVKDIANMVVKIEPLTYVFNPKTVMKSAYQSDFDFYPTWPHHYLTDHGEEMGSAYLLKLESQMTVSKNDKQIHMIFEKNSYRGEVIDSNMALKINPTSKPIFFHGSYSIESNAWTGSLVLYNSHNWRQFFTEFFPTHLPFHSEFPIASDFKTKLVKTMASIEVS